MRSGGVRARLLPAALLVATGTLSPSPDLVAQTIEGAVVDHGTGRVLPRAVVTLSDTSGERVALTVTNRKGRFTLSPAEPGVYRLSAMAMGYEPLAIQPAYFAAGVEREVELPLTLSPVPLPGIRVEVERARTDHLLDTQGFFRRRQRGFGRFFTPDEIEALAPSSHVDLLRRVPGIYFQENGYLGESLYCANSSVSLEHSGPDVPAVYVDGVRAYFPNIRGTAGPDVDLDWRIPVQHVAAIEIYRGGATTPAEFSSMHSTCTVVIWTKGG